MDGYKMLADSYRVLEAKETNPEQKADLQKEIKVLDFLGECEQGDINRIFSSGAFNDIVKAYCRKAMSNCEIDEKKIHEVELELKDLFDMYNVSDILG